MFGPTPTIGCAWTMCQPSVSIATRSRLVGSFRSNVEMKRLATAAGASAKKIAATTGRTASSRKSLSDNSNAAAAHAPTAALRVKVSATATASAGITSAAHVRSRRPKRTRARATPMTSISSPEYVM